MQLRTNTIALNAHRNLGITGAGMASAMFRLSSGFRINTAADDPAGMAISESMRAQIRGLDQASRNVQNGISLIETADAGLDSVHGMLQRIREIIVQAANDTNNLLNREAQQREVDQLMAEIDTMGDVVRFNSRRLFSGDFAPGVANGDGLWLQTGPNAGQGMTVHIGAVSVDAIDSRTVDGAHPGSPADPDRFTFARLRSGPGSGPGGTNEYGFANLTGNQIGNFTDVLDAAVNLISTERASLGAMGNRLEFTNRSLNVASENLQDAESRIRNADMALEMMRFVRYQVLQQMGMLVLAQANRHPGIFLELMG